MPTATKRTKRLSDAQLEDMLALTSHADSVELKLTIPDSERRSTVAALGMDPLDAQIRQVFFFDTPDLRLNSQGVVVRARRVQGRGDDTVVKLRPIVPDQLPPSVRKARGMVVEVDAMPGGYVCSASFKGALDTPQVKQAAAGERAVRKLFTKPQRAFDQEHAPEGLGMDDLMVLGPITVFKLKFSDQDGPRVLLPQPQGGGGRLANTHTLEAERWVASSRCSPGSSPAWRC